MDVPSAPGFTKRLLRVVGTEAESSRARRPALVCESGSVVPGEPWSVREPPHGGRAARRWRVRWTSARGSLDEKTRTMRTSPETFSEDDGFLAFTTRGSKSRAAAVLAQGTQRNLGRGHYLHPHVGRLVVLGRGHRPILETCDRLGDGESSSDRARYLSASNGRASSTTAARNDSSFGSRCAVREPRVSRVLATSRNRVQHERKR